MTHAVVATAGHVDHGKSTLVRLLTGTDPDRLPEERRRGLTVDLGFARADLPGGHSADLVDVPGHERYVGNALTGLAPAQAVLLVVAADEGWRPQTHEHLDAVVALGHTHVLAVLTRADLASPAQLAAAHAQTATRCAVAGVASEVVTSRPDDLTDARAALARLVDRAAPPDRAAGACLWVDRAFTVRGRGTVVTGTLQRGTLAAGDHVVSDRGTAVVRELQTHGTATAALPAPGRVALLLRPQRGELPRRGDLVTTGERPPATALLDVALPAGWPGEHRRGQPQVLVHVGTAAVPGRVRPLGDRWARVTLDAPLALAAGDRVVLQRPGSPPGERLVGAVVVDAAPPALDRRGAAAARAAWLADPVAPPEPGRQPSTSEAAGPAAARDALPPATEESLRKLTERLATNPFDAPRRDELLDLALDRRALAVAERRGVLLRLAPDLAVAPDALDRTVVLLGGLPAVWTVGDVTAATGASRRVVVPLLELLDRQGRTRRHPDGTRSLR